MEKLLELALNLSGEKEPPLIQSVLGGGKWDERKTVFRDCLGPLVELASKAGIQLSIKPHRSHAMSRPEQAVWLIEQLDAKGKLSLTFDYSHYAFREMAVEKTVAIALPHTGYVVVKDAVRQQSGKIDFLLPGTAGGFPVIWFETISHTHPALRANQKGIFTRGALSPVIFTSVALITITKSPDNI